MSSSYPFYPQGQQQQQQAPYYSNNQYQPPQAPPPPQRPPPQQQQPSGKYDQLSFLSQQDQLKFEQLFSSATNSVAISPEAARAILLKSNLSPHNLARVWELSDLNKTGDLLFPEFALALHLCNVVLRGGELPYNLEPNVQQEVSQQVDKINFSVPEGNSTTPDDKLQLNKPQTNDIFETNPVTQFADSAAAAVPSSYPNQNLLQVQQTGFNQPQLFTSPQKPPQQEFPAYYNSQSLANQPTGFGFQNGNAGVQQQQQQPYQDQPQQQQHRPSLTQQPTGAFTSSSSFSSYPPLPIQRTGFSAQHQPLPTQPQNSVLPLAHQPTGLVPLKSQTTGAPMQRQQTGLPPKLSDTITGNAQQQSSFPSLTQQPTGLIPLNTQQTGNNTAPLLTQQPTGLVPLQSTQTGNNASTAPFLTQQPTGKLVPLAQQPTGQVVPLTQQPTGKLIPLKTGVPLAPLQAQKTGFGQNSFFLTNLVEQSQTHSQSYNYLSHMTISNDEKNLFNKIFDNYDMEKKGLLSAEISAEIFRKSGLNREDLEKVWDVITRPNQTHLDKESFQMGMWIVYKRLNGFEIPEELPESLKPSSMKILDDVKNKLKIQSIGTKTMKKSSNSKIDGSRFKNNDDELITSSSRHRRRNLSSNSTTTSSAPTTTQSKKLEKLSIDEMKKLIKEKKILLDALAVQLEESADNEKTYEVEDSEAIEDLKQKIKNLPTTNGSSSSSASEREQLKSKFNQLTSKVPILINEISQVDTSITRTKLELFRLQNPTTIIGTGANGEITDDDKKKAKSKLLLQQKMAKLTGKPLDPEVEKMAQDATKLNEEAQKIHLDSLQSQQMIKDVESSIKEISASVLAGFNVEVDETEYKKWELGIGLQPEVQELVKSFRVSGLTNKLASLSVDTTRASYSSTIKSSDSPLITTPPVASSSPIVSSSPAVYSPISTPTTTTTSSSRPAYASEEERMAYIKEQARKKMEERMAKLGIKRSTSSSLNSSPLASPSIGGITTLTPQPSATYPPVTPVTPVATQGTTPVAAQEPQEVPEDNESSSDDDDEEEFQRMEEIRRLKRLERDARLASE